ncbi:MAG: hypothetical protein M3O34_00875 [Chloroflexota bacterium]|nr:hypothetical protein [Chloroflexota bacterium]
MIGPTADLLSLLYTAVALYTLWQLPGRWRALTDAHYTADDRNLATRIGFLLLTPLGVLAHEAAHYVAAEALGAQRTALSFRIYWGYVSYAPRLGPLEDWLVAVVGPAASLALGLVALAAATRLPNAWRDIMLAFAHATLLLVLIFYPLMSAVERVGDFVTIYGRAPNGLAVVAGAVHGLGLVAYVVVVRRLGRQGRRQAWLGLDARFAGRAVALSPDSLARLRTLEQDARFRRLRPEERRELDGLVELRDWSVEHNRAVRIVGAMEGEGGAPSRFTGPDESGLPLEPRGDARDGAGGLGAPKVAGPGVDLPDGER